MTALPQVQTVPIYFGGGLDLVTPPLQLKPGFVRSAQNFEADLNGGYARISGYERYDGRTSPSAVQYAILSFTGTAAVGDTIAGATSAATGKVVAVTASTLVLALVTGTFASETVNVSGSPVGTCVGPQLVDSASTPILHAQYTNLAADAQRALISAVPGSGSVLGVHVYDGDIYAFRNNAGGTAAVMHKATTSGWVAVTLGEEVSFTNANTSVGDGDTLTQGAVSATISRVVLETGSLASGVNTGRLIITGRSGGSFSAAAATSTGGGALTLSGAQSAISFAIPSGRFECVNHTFTGSSALRMYGCDGQNRAFEFDGTTLVPISTGMTADAPEHIAAHRGHLFLSFGYSVQHSRPGYPYEWSVIVGAGEIAMGDDVTGFQVQPGGASEAALTIFARSQVQTLYGSGTANWQLVPFRGESGARAWTQQFMANSIYLDDRGLTNLSAAQTYGNFVDATISKKIQPWLRERQGLAIASCVVREKNQYRLFFSTGAALFITMDNAKVVGMMPQLLSHTPSCATSAELDDGTEVVFFGATNGMVYQMEKGTSFDGDAIEAWIDLAFNNFGSPRVTKRYRHAMFEVAGSGYAEFSFTYELGYGASDIAQPGSQTIDASLLPAYWDAFTWDAFIWDGASLLPARAEIAGSAENLSLKIRSNSDYYSPIKVSGALVSLSPRRNLR